MPPKGPIPPHPAWLAAALAALPTNSITAASSRGPEGTATRDRRLLAPIDGITEDRRTTPLHGVLAIAQHPAFRALWQTGVPH